MHMQESLIRCWRLQGKNPLYKLFEVPAGQLYSYIRAGDLHIFVTAADSNTNAIASVCTSECPRRKWSMAGLKILWGVIIGVIAVMAVFTVSGAPRLLPA